MSRDEIIREFDNIACEIVYDEPDENRIITLADTGYLKATSGASDACYSFEIPEEGINPEEFAKILTDYIKRCDLSSRTGGRIDTDGEELTMHLVIKIKRK